MIFKLILVLTFALTVQAQIGNDYITAAPATVYEEEAMSPQNMDFDKANNMFIAHSGWYNDKLIHYYKFRMYTPGTYPGFIAPGSTFLDIPLQKIYFVTTTGDMSGVVGKPIIEYHTSDGLVYSDFMEVQLVTAPMGYTADMYKSMGDVIASGADVTATGIMLNIPVVPTNSTLQDPMNKLSAAPIKPVPVWYKGVEVWCYVFEVTSDVAATYFASTRVNPDGSDYGITVTPFASATAVTAIPLWHVNQFTRGVSADLGNFGGPSEAGMRNIINLDRADPGYSPLWSISWVTELPPNYSADQVSNFNDMTADNGFAFVAAPMFVNCPDIGAVGAINPSMTNSFDPEIDTSMDSNWLIGSDMSLIMQGGVNVSFATPDGTIIGTTQTNMMGAYEYELMSSDIPAGTTSIEVMAKDAVIRTIDVGSGELVMGDDYITAAPPTVYEVEAMSPQNMDFDKANNMFIAHSGWYNDKLIHYYKFRMYTPGTYPGLIAPGSTFLDIPLQKIYFVTTTGDMSGVVGKPIIEYHTSDGLVYSDFMEVQLVTAPMGYTADMYKSMGDVIASGADVTATGIMLNIPVVPTNSTLQDPMNKLSAAPIKPVPVWYKGVEVWCYVFEVTSDVAATYFASTRVNPDGSDYGITVTPFASATAVTAIPLWHVNQFTRGVSADLGNFGGPSEAGMRNIINLDRADPGYSPLWSISWVTELPPNYSADQVSNFNDMTADNGFAFVAAPMFVNCPDIGAVGAINPSMTNSFDPEIDTSMDSNWLIGSDMSLIMQGGVNVSFATPDGTIIGTTQTNMMGAYEYELMSSDIPAGTTSIEVMAKDAVIRTVELSSDDGKEMDDTSGVDEQMDATSGSVPKLVGSTPFPGFFASLTFLLMNCLFLFA